MQDEEPTIAYSGMLASRPVESQYASDGSVQMDELTVQVVTLYQRQSGLTDRLWEDFGKFSAMAVFLALAAPVATRQGWLPVDSRLGQLLLWMTVVIYVAFSIGNRSALLVAQNALERIASQAQMASKITLEVIHPPKVVMFQGVLSLFTTATLCAGIWVATTTPEHAVARGPALAVQPPPIIIAHPPGFTASVTR